MKFNWKINKNYPKLSKKFANLFLEGNRAILTCREATAVTYFDVDTQNAKLVFKRESAVLFGVESLDVINGEAERIIKEFNIDCQKTIDFLYDKHGSNYEVLK